MPTDVRPEDSLSMRTASLPSPGIPQFVKDHAPLFRLHPNDKYRPTDLNDFWSHVRPQIGFKDIDTLNPALPKLPLADLDEFNDHGEEGGRDVYLTSLDDVTKAPTWLNGVKKIDSIGGAGENQTGVVIIVDRGPHMFDVFYFVFWAFNYGGVVLGRNLGNHVGDWEHVMIRFKGGKPTKVWLSQHANGEAYTFQALEKNESGKRPILYIANGSHAIYARTGNIDHTIPNFNTTLPFLLVDQCAAGPIFDPLLTSYVYSYKAPTKDVFRHLSSAANDSLGVHRLFSPLIPSSPPPGWLLFNGHWGDETYPASDPRQSNLFSFHKFEGGPTGPADKFLVRDRIWPPNSHAAGQIVRTSLDGRTRLRDQLRRWGWKVCGRKMEVKGEPRRVFVDGESVD